MKRIVLLLFGLMVSLNGFCLVQDTLVYNPSKKLTWSDFKGKPKPADRLKGAEIQVTIYLKVKKVNFWTGKPKYDAFAVAYANTSWVKPEYKDAYTLAHEQLHFDIAHLYAETLEMEINSLNKTARQEEQVENLLKKYIKLMSEYQTLYDQETRGGNNKSKQKEWAAKVEKDLSVINKVL